MTAKVAANNYLKQFQAKMKTAFDPTGKKASEFEFYFGPNDFQILKNTEKESTFGKGNANAHGELHDHRQQAITAAGQLVG